MNDSISAGPALMTPDNTNMDDDEAAALKLEEEQARKADSFIDDSHFADEDDEEDEFQAAAKAAADNAFAAAVAAPNTFEDELRRIPGLANYPSQLLSYVANILRAGGVFDLAGLEAQGEDSLKGMKVPIGTIAILKRFLHGGVELLPPLTPSERAYTSLAAEYGLDVQGYQHLSGSPSSAIQTTAVAAAAAAAGDSQTPYFTLPPDRTPKRTFTDADEAEEDSSTAGDNVLNSPTTDEGTPGSSPVRSKPPKKTRKLMENRAKGVKTWDDFRELMEEMDEIQRMWQLEQSAQGLTNIRMVIDGWKEAGRVKRAYNTYSDWCWVSLMKRNAPEELEKLIQQQGDEKLQALQFQQAGRQWWSMVTDVQLLRKSAEDSMFHGPHTELKKRADELDGVEPQAPRKKKVKS